ncbi:MAG: hypothetical protein WA517_22240 [Candidatus Acidiferrum sp.]
MTRSAVQRMGLRSLQETQEDYAAFVHECHDVFKRALKILIDDMLALEGLVAEFEKNAPGEKERQAAYRYWLRLLELAYDSFIWIASNHDRSEVLKHYKGPKHGALVKQNIESVITVANQLNKRPDIFAIPLDFSRFSCISDLLRLRRYPDGRCSSDFIEVKEGTVNDEIFEVIKARDPDRYLEFFDKYGEKGIAQIERVFKQGKVVDDRLKLFDMQPGIYHEERAVRIVTEMKIGKEDSFHEYIEPLIQKARAGEYSVQTIGDCLVIAALDATSEERCVRTDYVARCVVHAGFGDPAVVDNQDALLQALQSIKFTDWRAGFGSVLCIPPLLRPFSTRTFLDLLFGRIRLHLYFDATSFVRLCTDHGVRAGFLKKRTTNRLRTTYRWRKDEVPLFGGRAIGYILGGYSAVFSPSYYHEILFNWRTPSAIVGHMKQMELELANAQSHQADGRSSRQLFSENDFEPA